MEPEIEAKLDGIQIEEPQAPQKSGITELFGTILIVVGVLIFLALLSFQYQIAQGIIPQSQSNLIGTVGHYTAQLLFYLFGKSCFLAGPYFFLLGALTIYRGGFTDPLSRLVAMITLMIGSSLLGGLFFIEGNLLSEMAGGLISVYLGGLFLTLFGFYGALILSFGIFTAGLFLSIRIPIPLLLNSMSQSMRDRLQNYSRIFTGNLYYPEPATASNIDLPSNVSPQKSQPPANTKAKEEVPPWIQKVEKATEANENLHPNETTGQTQQSSSTQINADQYDQNINPEMNHRTETKKTIKQNQGNWFEQGSHKEAGFHIHENRGFFSSSTKPSSIIKKNKINQMQFDGYFSQNDSRFHFRSNIPFSPAEQTINSLSIYQDRNSHKNHIDDNHSKGFETKKNSEPLMEKINLDILPNKEAEHNFQTATIDRLDNSNKMIIPNADVSKTYDEPIESIENDIAIFPDENVEEFAGNHNSVHDENIQNKIDSSFYQSHNEMIDEAYNTDDDIEKNSGTNFNPDDEIKSMQSHSTDLADYNKENIEEEPESDYIEKNDSAARETQLVSEVPEIKLVTNKYFIPVDILNSSRPIALDEVERDIHKTRIRLEQVFLDYGIEARVVHCQRGPIITLYEVKPAPGVKVSKIQGIVDEIKMNLEAQSVRIIAPIPGKSTVGIEIPNQTRESIALKEMVNKSSKYPEGLGIVLGADINGNKVFTDLTRLPHLLIAGATGSGKSVYMNSVIASLLYHYSPEDLRFIMIDPKMVELRLFEGIPHLTMPVITDVRMANKALGWAVAEMERRYAILSSLKCRDIRSYNDRIKNNNKTGKEGVNRSMPYMIVLIDELADLMMIAAKDVEDSIIRLTQKARAVGIHVIMATQRPSVDVITALIKANCPARIAFQVSQKTDSRTILDMNGAETLLGKGDMLYRSPISTEMTRLQAPLITEKEIEDIVAETRRHGKPVYVDLQINEENSSGSDADEVDEQLFEQAWEIVLESGKTSTSYVQRRLRIGYNRAANIIERLEERGYLGPAMGNKPREILKRS